ncbi:NucA/NucB deoxyribonuclease domain-containing protein [Streptomyces exfoliatus]|uniref:NucA/NucB deoxyribonuclease domain-containing protein n=1 Tax=Streptomyces exfoliatus TaxID=1905 RepID=UPI0037B58041
MKNRRTLFAVVGLSAVMAFSGQPAAGAADDGGQIVPTIPHVVDAEHPVLKIGGKVPAELLPGNHSKRKVETWETLTEKGDVAAGHAGATYKVDLDDYKVDGTAPRRSLSWDPVNDCRGFLNGQVGVKYVNRFQYCSVKKQAFYWTDSTGTILGTTSYVQTTAGQAPQDRREVYYMVNLGYFDVQGYYRDIPFPVVGETLGYAGEDGSNPACDVVNSSNNPQTLQDWRTNGAAIASIVYDQDKALGVGRDFVSRCAIYTVTAPDGIKYRDAATGIRFDSASYLEGTGGGVFLLALPTMVYDTASSSHGAVANHILTAYENPAATTPYVAGKKVPGRTWELPLSRLYEGWDSAAATQRQKNITAKNNACAPIRPADPTGLDCDEFPFGSTWEGPAAGSNFSVRYLDLSQNRSAGASLGNWYAKDRILHRDAFTVEIVTSS